jgi:ribosomal protein S18 acetylase RimI-like enzyme
MLIRPATQQDLPAICKLGDQINREHFSQHPDIFCERQNDPEDAAFWQAAMEEPTACMLVAEKDLQVIGFITVKTTQNSLIPFLQKNKICRIGTIVVDAQTQGSGVGTQLMEAALAWGKQQGCEEVRLEVFHFNQTAIRLYEKLGFQAQLQTMRKTF